MNPVKVTVHPKNEGEKKEAVFVHITTVIGVQKNIGTLSTFMDQKKEKKKLFRKILFHWRKKYKFWNDITIPFILANSLLQVFLYDSMSFLELFLFLFFFSVLFKISFHWRTFLESRKWQSFYGWTNSIWASSLPYYLIYSYCIVRDDTT